MAVSKETAGKRALSGVWGGGGEGRGAAMQGSEGRQRVRVASRENAKWDPRDPDDNRNLA